jgi:hypothetical protein
MSQPDDNTNDCSPRFYQSLSTAITELRERLRMHYEHIFPGQKTLIADVLEEAESVAWCTPFPHLFLPDLAEVRMARIASAA